MLDYQLNIQIEPADLRTICKAGQKIVLMKAVTDSTPVAWVTFSPFPNNTVQFQEKYAIYGSTSSLENGASIFRMADIEAIDQIRYPFQRCATFGEPMDNQGITTGQFAVLNDYEELPCLTFGMAQGIQVNGTAFPNKPINAQVVPRKHTAKFTPLTKISLFLDGQINEGMVLTDVSNPKVELTFGGVITDITVKYNSATGIFERVD